VHVVREHRRVARANGSVPRWIAALVSMSLRPELHGNRKRVHAGERIIVTIGA